MNARMAIKRVIGNTFKHRVYAFGTTGAGTSLAGTTSVYVSLLASDPDPDYDLVSNGTTISECEVDADITAMDLFFVLKANQSIMHELMLFKDADGEIATITPSANVVGVQDVTELNAFARKNTMAYIPYYLTSNADARPRGISVSRAALGRTRSMHAGDIIKLLITNNGASTATWWLFGSIWTLH